MLLQIMIYYRQR